MRHGITGTKLKPVGVGFAVNVPEAVLPSPSFREATTGAGSAGAGVAVGEGLGTVVKVAEVRDAIVDLGVPPATPPQPAKENTMRDKQINERIPETQDESWRRIGYLSAIQGEQLWGCGAEL